MLFQSNFQLSVEIISQYHFQNPNCIGDRFAIYLLSTKIVFVLYLSTPHSPENQPNMPQIFVITVLVHNESLCWVLNVLKTSKNKLKTLKVQKIELKLKKILDMPQKMFIIIITHNEFMSVPKM